MVCAPRHLQSSSWSFSLEGIYLPSQADAFVGSSVVGHKDERGLAMTVDSIGFQVIENRLLSAKIAAVECTIMQASVDERCFGDPLSMDPHRMSMQNPKDFSPCSLLRLKPPTTILSVITLAHLSRPAEMQYV